MKSGEEDEPEEFLDPITLSIMVEAMMSPCGHSFSRESITTWLRQNHPSCPVCKGHLLEAQMLPNYALRSAIERWTSIHNEKQPSAPSLLEMQPTPAPSTRLGIPPKKLDESFHPPEPVKTHATSSSSAPAGADVDYDADTMPYTPAVHAVDGGGAGGADEEEGVCLILTADARQAPQGCLVCNCDGPVYCCDQAHQCEEGRQCPDPFPWYTMLTKLLCVFSFGNSSTYTRRTSASLLFPLFVIVFALAVVWDYSFLLVFWVVAFFVISPLWIIIRAPIMMIFPLQYENYIKPSCWDKTFGCQ